MDVYILNGLNNFSSYSSSNEFTLNGGSNLAAENLFHSIAEFLQYSNHGSSLILYSLSSKAFRNELKIFFKNSISMNFCQC